MFDLKSDGICRKITESQRSMFLHDNTSRLNDFFLCRREEAGAGLCSVTLMNHISLLLILLWKMLTALYSVMSIA